MPETPGSRAAGFRWGHRLRPGKYAVIVETPALLRLYGDPRGRHERKCRSGYIQSGIAFVSVKRRLFASRSARPRLLCALDLQFVHNLRDIGNLGSHLFG